jgi:hypothetical protein
VQKYVCQSFVALAQTQSEPFTGVLENVVQFMLYCTRGPESVRLDACEFWLVLFEQHDLQIELQRFLPRYTYSFIFFLLKICVFIRKAV